MLVEMTIDFELLREQYAFLCKLTEDIENRNVTLPTEYDFLPSYPTEYLDGILGVIHAVFDAEDS